MMVRWSPNRCVFLAPAQRHIINLIIVDSHDPTRSNENEFKVRASFSEFKDRANDLE